MKRIISFIIAISILFSIFAVPATAVTKSWYHAIESVNGAIEGSWDFTPSVEAIDVLGFKGVVGCIFSFDGWLLPDEGQIIEKFVVNNFGAVISIKSIYNLFNGYDYFYFLFSHK